MKLNNIKKYIVPFIIYLLLFIAFSLKMDLYQYRLENFPDEFAHIAYVYNLESNNRIIPDFRDIEYGIKDIDNNDELTNVYTVNTDHNYLGHPPLYYNLLRLSSGIKTIDGSVYINVNALRDFSQIIASVALIICFYIGLTRIDGWQYHLLYGSIILTLPMISYSCAGINNDVLTFLGVSIFWLAFVRFSEDKRNYLTYILLALGIFITIMSKLTGGLILVVACVCYLISVFIKEKNASILLTPKFYVTIPVYLIIALYFGHLYLTYHTVQPSLAALAPEQLIRSEFYIQPENRIEYTFIEYTKYYIYSFFVTWGNIMSHIVVASSPYTLDFYHAGFTLVFFLPIAAAFNRKGKKLSPQVVVSLFIYAGVWFTALYQFRNAHNSFINNGYLGGFQSRYYHCTLPVMAFLTISAIKDRFDSVKDLVNKKISNKVLNAVSSIICVMFSLLVIFGDSLIISLVLVRF